MEGLVLHSGRATYCQWKTTKPRLHPVGPWEVVWCQENGTRFVVSPGPVTWGNDVSTLNFSVPYLQMGIITVAAGKLMELNKINVCKENNNNNNKYSQVGFSLTDQISCHHYDPGERREKMQPQEGEGYYVRES